MTIKRKHMYRKGSHRKTDSMSGLITGSYGVLLVMSRFGIGLGVGNKSIGEVCAENGVDTETFLAVVNMLSDGEAAVDPSSVSVAALMGYLHNSHDYFLDFRLPKIRENLVAALPEPHDELTRAIIGYFDKYVAEVNRHMKYEERMVFPYVSELLAGHKPADYSIEVFSKRHDQVEAKLTEFKEIFIKYYPAPSSNEINSVLFEIFNCENDLASHNEVEDRLFVPATEQLERKLAAGS